MENEKGNFGNFEMRDMISSGHREALFEITALKEELLNFKDMLDYLAESSSKKDTYMYQLEDHLNSLLDDLNDKRFEQLMIKNAPVPPSTKLNPSLLPYDKTIYPILEGDESNDLNGGLRRVGTRRSKRMRLKATRKRKHLKHKR